MNSLNLSTSSVSCHLLVWKFSWGNTSRQIVIKADADFIFVEDINETVVWTASVLKAEHNHTGFACTYGKQMERGISNATLTPRCSHFKVRSISGNPRVLREKVLCTAVHFQMIYSRNVYVGA